MNPEKILAISAVFISILALCVSIWQGKLSKEHNRLSLAPYLQVSPKLVGDSESGLYLENAGTGSARIQSAYISARGKSFDLTSNGWPKFCKHIGVIPGCFRNSWLRPGAAIIAGKELPLISLTKADLLLPECDAEAIKFLTEPDVKLTIQYISPYNDIYQLSEKITINESDLGEFADFIDMLKNKIKSMQLTTKVPAD